MNAFAVNCPEQANANSSNTPTEENDVLLHIGEYDGKRIAHDLPSWFFVP
jgi:hypothetical protein